MSSTTPLRRLLSRLDEVTTQKEKASPLFPILEAHIRKANLEMQSRLTLGDFPYPNSESTDEHAALKLHLRDGLTWNLRPYQKDYMCDDVAMSVFFCFTSVGIWVPFVAASYCFKLMDRHNGPRKRRIDFKHQQSLHEIATINAWYDRL